MLPPLILRLALLAGLATGPCILSQAQTSTVHWAYSAFLGTGRYSVDGTRESYVLGLRPRREWREPELTDDGQRRVGLALRIPFSIGAHEFDADNIARSVRLSSVSTVTAVPGIEIEIPISQKWKLKPLAHLGWGTETHSSASAWIYSAGIKSELSFPATRVGLRLVNSLRYIGYSPRGASSSRSRNTLPLLTGLEFRLPLKNTRLGGEPVNIHWHIARTHYLNELSFDDPPRTVQPTDISELWEVGVAFSRGQSKLELWRFSVERIGLAFRAESGGDFRGVTVTFSSLFDR